MEGRGVERGWPDLPTFWPSVWIHCEEVPCSWIIFGFTNCFKSGPYWVWFLLIWTPCNTSSVIRIAVSSTTLLKQLLFIYSNLFCQLALRRHLYYTADSWLAEFSLVHQQQTWCNFTDNRNVTILKRHISDSHRNIFIKQALSAINVVFFSTEKTRPTVNLQFLQCMQWTCTVCSLCMM